ncbi:MAG: hypothetical protein Q4D60_01055 [Eubacteriales bacterium]|nr:hypothetical protein [Eubacteriales bacterium]
MNRREIPAVNMGVSLIILIFITLCLVTFSVLSLENAVADRRLSEKAAEHTTAYYKASNRVYDRLKVMQEALDRGEDTCVEGERRLLEEMVEEKQKLMVTVTMRGTQVRPSYEITDWRVQALESWEADNSMDVYTGKGEK